MSNCFRLLIIAIALLPTISVAAQDVPELKINSERYIVIDAATGQVYAQKGARDEVAIASLTKIFTAVQALEMAAPETIITTDESDLFGPSNTLMEFGPNEDYTLEDLIYGMLLPSGNDAAHAIARSLGGQPGDSPDEAVDRFMALLNQRVKDMGLENTTLVTPSGWGVPGHHSSAWDVAAMMQHALEYPVIESAISTRSYTTSNGALTVTNTNKLMNSYDALIGGKTGYDLDSGWCLVEVASKNDRRMIAVTLDGVAPDDWYDDNRVLLEYGFEQATASADSWSGDVVAWQNPSVAMMSRTTQSESAFVAGETNERSVVKPDTPPLSTIPGDPVSGGNVVAAVSAIVVLLAVRAMIAFRRWPFGWVRRVDADDARA